MLHFLPPTSKLSSNKLDFEQVWTWVVKRATSLFNRFVAMLQYNLHFFVVPFTEALKFLSPTETQTISFGRPCTTKTWHF